MSGLIFYSLLYTQPCRANIVDPTCQVQYFILYYKLSHVDLTCRVQSACLSVCLYVCLYIFIQ